MYFFSCAETLFIEIAPKCLLRASLCSRGGLHISNSTPSKIKSAKACCWFLDHRT